MQLARSASFFKYILHLVATFSHSLIISAHSVESTFSLFKHTFKFLGKCLKERRKKNTREKEIKRFEGIDEVATRATHSSHPLHTHTHTYLETLKVLRILILKHSLCVCVCTAVNETPMNESNEGISGAFINKRKKRFRYI